MPQHCNVVEAARTAGVSLIAYTSVLHADRSPFGLAEDHRQTEALLARSGVPFVLLRNGWYTENYMASVPAALAHDALIGAAGEGRIASAARADYADAAAAVLVSTEEQAGWTYELAGDTAYPLTELAAEVSRQTGREIALPRYAGGGLQGCAARRRPAARLGGRCSLTATRVRPKAPLFDDGRDLSRLIGRPTISLAESVRKALQAA